MNKNDILCAESNFLRALAEPEKYCCSGRCPDTNWGGNDRLHLRSSKCPEFSQAELEGYLDRCDTAWEHAK